MPHFLCSFFFYGHACDGFWCGSQVGVDGNGQPQLAEMSAEGVSYEPVGVVEGLADDAMEHGGMRDLATVSRVISIASWCLFVVVRGALLFQDRVI